MFINRVKHQYRIEAGDDNAYWSCFTFDNKTPDELHCTHKYFGDQTQGIADAILKVMNDHFAQKPFEDFTVPFVNEAFFGEDKDTRVLKPDNIEQAKKEFHLDLRRKLDQFAEDQHPSYQPHVSTDILDEVNEPFTGYAFCRGDNIIKQWKAWE